MSDPLLLVDADSLLYRAAASCIHSSYVMYDKDGYKIYRTQSKRGLNKILKHLTEEDRNNNVVVIETVEDSEQIAKYNLDIQLSKLEATYPGHDLLLYITDTTCNWRRTIYPDYKGNRVETKPSHLQFLYKYVKKLGAIEVPCEEADYLIACAAKSLKSTPTQYVVCHIDHDLNMITGEHYNYVTGSKYRVTTEQANREYINIMLAGDTGDNIKGLNKVGKVKAKQFADEHANTDDLEDKIAFLYLLFNNPHYEAIKAIADLRLKNA